MTAPSEKARRRAAVPHELERREREEARRKREEEELHAWRLKERPTGAEARLRRMHDTAFELVCKDSSNNPGAALVRRTLARLFPDVSSDEYAPVYFDLFNEGQKLLRVAGEVADMYRERRLSHVEALRQLEERCPGFSVRTYESAFGDGMFATR
jgi:hypothetical protein